MIARASSRAINWVLCCLSVMEFMDDLRRVEGHIAEARRFVQRQKGLVIRVRAAGVNTFDAQSIRSLLESNLKRLEDHRDWLRNSVK